MIRTYVMNIRPLEEETAFQEKMKAVSPFRQQKIALMKNKRDKLRSLGAALAFDAALKEYGLREKDMAYVLGKQGKQSLCNYPGLHFSLSHAGDYAICSLGDAETGCDIERVRPDKMRVADRFFTEEEKAWLCQAGSAEEQESRLFRIWTMKESFLKVTGLGMSLSLRDFTVFAREDGTGGVRHSLNHKSYYIKEYMLPDCFRQSEERRMLSGAEEPGYRKPFCGEESGCMMSSGHKAPEYRISVCCESTDFAPEAEAVME